MINIQLPGIDLNEYPAEQHSALLQRQMAQLTNQIMLALGSIEASDIRVSEDQTLADLLEK